MIGSSPRVWGQDCFARPLHKILRIIPTRMGTRLLAICKGNICQDHPHAYGDKCAVTLCRFLIPRIIPTRMGTRATTQIVCLQGRDHPHAYGDKKIARLSDGVLKGSSPRVWGQVAQINSLERDGRIIPTRMGTSTVSPQSDNSDKDHPHAYGDKLSPCTYKGLGLGSSPRVWGQADCQSYLYESARIIPTRMGTSALTLNFLYTA